MTLYRKPKDITYTDMAIWIDNNAYKDDCDDEQLFEYLYHIVKINAVKKKMFEKSFYYEDFAIYATGIYFYRLFKRRENNKQRIKSIKNYIQSSLNFVKIDFQQENFCQCILPIDIISDINCRYEIVDLVPSIADDIKKVDFEYCLTNICQTIKYYISKLPTKKYSAEPLNIYISCLLTLLNMITLPNKCLKHIDTYSRKCDSNDISKLLKSQDCIDSVILYHLDKNMQNYIYILCRKIKAICAHDLSEILSEQINNYSLMYLLLQNEMINKRG